VWYSQYSRPIFQEKYIQQENVLFGKTSFYQLWKKLIVEKLYNGIVIKQKDSVKIKLDVITIRGLQYSPNLA